MHTNNRLSFIKDKENPKISCIDAGTVYVHVRNTEKIIREKIVEKGGTRHDVMPVACYCL